MKSTGVRPHVTIFPNSQRNKGGCHITFPIPQTWSPKHTGGVMHIYRNGSINFNFGGKSKKISVNIYDTTALTLIAKVLAEANVNFGIGGVVGAPTTRTREEAENMIINLQQLIRAIDTFLNNDPSTILWTPPGGGSKTRKRQRKRQRKTQKKKQKTIISPKHAHQNELKERHANTNKYIKLNGTSCFYILN